MQNGKIYCAAALLVCIALCGCSSSESDIRVVPKDSDKMYVAAESEATLALTDTVFVTAGGSKYHIKADCSGMKAPKGIPLADAEANGYEPCKRCCKGMASDDENE